MSNKHEITLTQVPGQNGQTVWEMSVGGKKYMPEGYPTIHLPYNSGHHDFEFTIANPGTVKFMPYVKDQSSPIYIQETTGKPTKGVINHQIENIDLKDNGTKLVFKDKITAHTGLCRTS